MGKDWRQEEKGTAEDERVGWHHWLSGHEFEQAPGVDNGQWSLGCYSPWGHKESDTTEWLNWTELKVWLTLCIFFFQLKVFGDHKGTQSRPLLLLNSMRAWSLGTSKGPLCPSVSSASPGNSVSLPVSDLPSWLILSFILWWLKRYLNLIPLEFETLSEYSYFHEHTVICIKSNKNLFFLGHNWKHSITKVLNAMIYLRICAKPTMNS